MGMPPYAFPPISFFALRAPHSWLISSWEDSVGCKSTEILCWLRNSLCSGPPDTQDPHPGLSLWESCVSSQSSS